MCLNSGEQNPWAKSFLSLGAMQLTIPGINYSLCLTDIETKRYLRHKPFRTKSSDHKLYLPNRYVVWVYVSGLRGIRRSIASTIGISIKTQTPRRFGPVDFPLVSTTCIL